MRYPVALEFVGGHRDGHTVFRWLSADPGRVYYLATLDDTALPLQRIGDPPDACEVVPTHYTVFERQNECRLVDGILANVYKERTNE